MSSAYYNEIDPFCAEWLKRLMLFGHIAPGVIDTRSVEDVRPDDLRGFTQCHFFAGIGVWSYALRPCIDGKARPVEPGTFPLAHGAPARVGRLRAYGNAIVAPLAEEFIRAYLEC